MSCDEIDPANPYSGSEEEKYTIDSICSSKQETVNDEKSDSGGCSTSLNCVPNVIKSNVKETWRTAVSKKNIIINYLPQYVDDRELHNIFAPYGCIESVRVMKDLKAGYSFGFGFVNFVNDSDGEKAVIALNETKLGNKKIKVSFARAAADDTQQSNLYVSDLPRDATEDDVAKLFSSFGEILQLSLLRDKIFNIPRGVAFIRYRERTDALNAILGMNGTIPEGLDQPIKVRMALDYGRQRAASMASFRTAFNLNQRSPQSRSTQDLNGRQQDHVPLDMHYCDEIFRRQSTRVKFNRNSPSSIEQPHKLNSRRKTDNAIPRRKRYWKNKCRRKSCR